MMTARLIIAGVMITLGVLFFMISAIGVLRLPDFLSRLHSSGIGETLGMILFGLGIIIYLGINLVSVKVLIIFVILSLVNPVGTHLIGKAALWSETGKNKRRLSGSSKTGKTR